MIQLIVSKIDWLIDWLIGWCLTPTLAAKKIICKANRCIWQLWQSDGGHDYMIQTGIWHKKMLSLENIKDMEWLVAMWLGHFRNNFLGDDVNIHWTLSKFENCFHQGLHDSSMLWTPVHTEEVIYDFLEILQRNVVLYDIPYWHAVKIWGFHSFQPSTFKTKD